jgi:hypothetical protein
MVSPGGEEDIDKDSVSYRLRGVENKIVHGNIGSGIFWVDSRIVPRAAGLACEDRLSLPHWHPDSLRNHVFLT